MARTFKKETKQVDGEDAWTMTETASTNTTLKRSEIEQRIQRLEKQIADTDRQIADMQSNKDILTSQKEGFESLIA